ncbi:MAG: thiamine phosphate synthase [Myxococcales bacterium]|nr:thiamine phosphate synthase [Myxococcales bacterium]MCB9896835.1 thiamine phosphate synthase [Planctomycetota bacterium]
MTASRLDRLRRARLYLVASADGPTAPAPGTPFWRAIREAGEAGVGVVQLRLKGCAIEARRAALALARGLLPDDVLLVVNDDLAAVFGPDGTPLADGLHLGREDAAALAAAGAPSAAPGAPSAATDTGSTAPPSAEAIAAGLRAARSALGDALLLGTSTRARDEIARAIAAGADHVGFGAMAPTSTKDGTTRADPAELAECVRAFPALPIFAIGGLSPGTLHLVRDAGCTRAAIGAAILDARDVGAATRACLAALDA